MDRRAAFQDPHRLESPLVEKTRESMARTRALPPEMPFDTAGHALYARVTALPDFGMARAEAELVRTCGREMLARAGHPREIVDLRSGTGIQARPLLGAVERYVAIERCRPVLDDTVGGIAAAFPRLEVQGVVGDAAFGLGAGGRDPGPRLFLHLGGALGRLDLTEARLELARVRAGMARDDRLLVGMDLFKEPYRLQAAYDDAGGVYAAFARNALRRANREVGTDFRLSEWQTVVEVQPDRGRVEVRMESRSAQCVCGGQTGAGWEFGPGEGIVVERAQKPTEGQFAALALGAGFRVEASWSDPALGFATFLLSSESFRYMA